MNKIRELFIKLFSRKTKLLNEYNNTPNETVNSSKNDELNISPQKLFSMFRNGLIKEEELTEVQKQEIATIYIKKIEEEKRKIQVLKNKLAQYE